ncbi:MAG: PUA domain-containing protein, partial [Halochromatium sp.]
MCVPIWPTPWARWHHCASRAGCRTRCSRPWRWAVQWSQRRKRWMAFNGHVSGGLTLDEGAVRAVRDEGGSLLPAGIRKVIGEFQQGDLVPVYRRLLADLPTTGLPLHEAERCAFGLDHAAAGQLLLTNWRLPEPLA